MRSLLIFLLTAFWSSAQQSTVSTGNSNTVTGTEISFSIGITFYVDQSNSGLMIESGVQHAYQATVGTSGVYDTHVGVWPNPVQDALHLTTPVSINIFSTQGELVYSGKTDIVDMSVFDAGIYLDGQPNVGNISVDERFRNQGFAKILYKKLISELKKV